MDHLGCLIHLVLTYFDVFVVFKQGFGTQIDKLAMRGSQRVLFFALIHQGSLSSHRSIQVVEFNTEVQIQNM